MCGRPCEPTRSGLLPRVAKDFPAFGADACGIIDGLPASQVYPPGVELLAQGHPAGDVFFIEHGLVKLLRLQAAGQEAIVGLRSAGWFLAAAAAILDLPCAATAMTVTPCSLSRVGAEAFRGLIRRNGDLSWWLHRMHAEEVCAQLIHIADRASLSARERLERLLAQLAPGSGSNRDGEGVSFQLPLKHWEIAQLIDVTPQYLCDLFQDLERRGLIRRHQNQLILAPGLVTQGDGSA